MITKASRIRAALKQLGSNAPAQSVIELLSDQGVSVSPQQISNERTRMRRQNASSVELTVSAVKKVKLLVDELGSIQLVRRALDDLEELTRPTSLH
jgi:hypothetical protein